MRIGAHVSSAGGLDKAIDRAVELEVECLQLFASPPQGWAMKPPAPEVVAAFREKAAAAGLQDQSFFHGVYLVNLATENPENLHKGVASLSFYLDRCHETGVKGVIFHVGSHKGAGFDAVLPQIAGAMKEVLARSDGDSWLIIENNAGQGAQIAGNFTEIGRIMDAVGSPRVKVCLDTCHSLSAGYDLRNEAGVAAAMDEFRREVGWQHLVAVHANDSKTPLGSGVDRHENIGEGHLGLAGFLAIMKHPAFQAVPFMLEVPGMEGKGPDAENMRRLRELRTAALG
ncbi:MAG: deoxyribonuclease IV [Dehalococcoidia bacterium]|nr:deoxyribonuclease IV [Dehalococcoidia bacterium]